MKWLYDIENLKCNYQQSGDKIVLDIEKLIIPGEELVFIVGKSGIGKSTALETLGLMNYTIHSYDKFAINTGEKEISLPELWQKKNKVLSDFRKKQFSFIFQDTNLMQNFTPYENIYLTLLLQGKSQKEAIKITKSYIEKLFADELGEDIGASATTKLSGGQRQRLAFIRALAPDFTVLFGDEPTGNLDAGNANLAIQVMKKEIIEKKKTAIIVSHDLDLALEFADRIVYIKEQRMSSGNGHNDNYTYGKIDNDSIYIRKSQENDLWKSNNNDSLSKAELKKYLEDKVNEKSKAFVI